MRRWMFARQLGFASAFGVLSLLGLYCHAPLARGQELSLEAPAVGITLDPAAESATPSADAIERLLRAAGCPKINLQVRNSNHLAIEFYRKLGYSMDEVTSMGKRLEHDDS